MARITRLELDPITIDTANATVDVHLDIPKGTLTVAGQTIRADGLDVQTFDFSKPLARRSSTRT